MKQIGNLRLASKELGDDTTLTRYAKVNTEHKKPRRLQPRLPGIGLLAFVIQARTKFSSRVLPVSSMNGNILTSGHSNVKIGRDVRKGHHLGYWIYYLSLEERKTCPTACANWQNCYGNNMPFAKRVIHDDPEFLPALEKNINQLCKKHYGVLLRLHQLGDFYSSQYVHFWKTMMDRHPNLAVYGYTAHDRDTVIGRMIASMNEHYGKRWRVRFSNTKFPEKGMGATTIADESAKAADAFICPEQSGRTKACATCGACWGTEKNVAFLEH